MNAPFVVADSWTLQRVASALDREPSTFAELVQRLDGLFPIDALKALAELSCAGDATGASARALLAQSKSLPKAVIAHDQIACLPLPHPSDYEWRFDAETAQAMLERVARESNEAALTLLVGMPSLVSAIARGKTPGRFAILGTDDVVWSALETITRGDGRFVTARNGELASTAIVDPPWYAPAYREMFGVFAHLCGPSARLLVGAPPAGARPSASMDRTNIIALAGQFGFVATGTELGALGYRSPAFELATLSSAGISTPLPNWRRGDLLVFEKRGETHPAPCATSRPIAFELTLGGVRLRLTPHTGTTGKPLTPVAEGEIFPTVSTRAPRRTLANLWTSGNRAYEVDSVSALAALGALALAAKVSANSSLLLEKLVALSEYSATQALMTQLQDVAARETADMETLVGGASWLRSVNDARFLNGSLSDFLANLNYGDASPANC